MTEETKMKRFTLLTIIALLLAACAADMPAVDTPVADTPVVDAPSSPGTDLIRVDLPRLTAPQVDEDHISQLAQGNNRFAFDLYHAIRADSDENLIYSPYSISLAFSMVYAGARGQTENEITQTLHFLPQDIHHLAFNALDQRLLALAGDNDGEEEDRFQLNIANAVWGQIGLPFEEAYLITLAEQYGAGLRASDFAQQPEKARQEINDWVEEQTAERIQDILPPGTIDPATRLVLANAIYFNAAWRFPFDEAATQEGSFTLLDGSQITVPLMRQSGARILYVEEPEYQAVIMPYAGEEVQMLVILPQEGQFENVEAALSADFLNQVRTQTQLRDVQLTMPRFEFDADLDLKGLLTSLGMNNPFSGVADFNGIVDGGGLYITDALHRGTITVNEEGTEAAAVTVIVLAESMLQTAEVTLDRPFIFTIMDQQTGAILFLGRVMNPA
jgi:serpin B